MSTIAVSENHTGTAAHRIYNFLEVTGNSHTARELGHLLGMSAGTVRRRLTDLSKGDEPLVVPVASVRGPVREEYVYAAA